MRNNTGAFGNILYFNFINYSYIYNGGGVAVGDINNDGLEDLYFSSNQGSNALYLNKGDFKFDDITQGANVADADGWTTGVSMIDINNDGWLDIYVCKSGSLKEHHPRKNKLYINQQNNTFKEDAAAWGIDHFGFSVQAYFFDYDMDGDLDMYLVNHRFDFHQQVFQKVIFHFILKHLLKLIAFKMLFQGFLQHVIQKVLLHFILKLLPLMVLPLVITQVLLKQ